MAQVTRYPTELRERAVRMVVEHRKEYPSEWAAICSIAEKCGMTPETLRLWLRRSEVDGGRRPGVASEQQERIRELERENRELRRANEILKAAAALFARELDPRLPKPCASSPPTRPAGESSRSVGYSRSPPLPTTRQ
jgi:transposase